MENELLLLSGNDIPFAQARINIHQPKIKEKGIYKRTVACRRSGRKPD